jgi:hypothetical protein
MPRRKQALRVKGRGVRTMKRKGRIVAASQDYAALVWTVCFGAECACGCGRKAETAHHLVPRSQGGDDIIDCLAPLAGDGTRLCHGAFETKQRTYDLDARTYVEPEQVAYGIRDYLERPAQRPKRAYIVRKAGQAFLDAKYPRRKEETL